jgi:acyl carrier protein
MGRALKIDEGQLSSISPETSAADLAGWTSVNHLSLVLELEREFDIKFDNDEIIQMGSVQAICDRLKAKGVAD